MIFILNVNISHFKDIVNVFFSETLESLGTGSKKYGSRGGSILDANYHSLWVLHSDLHTADITERAERLTLSSSRRIYLVRKSHTKNPS